VSLLDGVRAFPRAPRYRMARVTVTGDWDAGKLALLLEGVHGLLAAEVIADVDAAELGAPDTPDRALADYLETGLPPLWSAFRSGRRSLTLGGTLTGPGGMLASIVDSVPALGDNVIHLQPLDWLAAGLRAGPGCARLGVAPEDIGAVTQVVFGASLECLRP
jgi:hypothetical protein